MIVTVRPRQDSDLDALAEVLVRVHAKDGYPVEGVADPKAWLTPPREIAAWTALADDRPIGHISLTQADASEDAAAVWRQHDSVGSIDTVLIPVRLFVDPKHRRSGVADALMRVCREMAHAENRSLVFDVMEKDQEAIRLYESRGAKPIGKVQHDAGNGKVYPAIVFTLPSPIKKPD